MNQNAYERYSRRKVFVAWAVLTSLVGAALVYNGTIEQPAATVTVTWVATPANATERMQARAQVMGTVLFHDSYTLDSVAFLRQTHELLEALHRVPQRGLPRAGDFSHSDLRYRHPKYTTLDNIATMSNFTARICSGSANKRLRIMVVCGMHAREMFTSDLCRSWMLYTALSTETRDPVDCTDESEREAAPFDWAFVPIANEAGRDIVVRAHDNDSDPLLCHRGNRRGVDLNRNWKTYDNKREHPLEKRPHDAKEEDPGVEAFSEAETVLLRDVVKDFSPDLLLSIHTGTVAILTPYDDTLELPSRYGDAVQLANWMAHASRCKLAKGGCSVGSAGRTLYISRGTMTDYAYRQNIAGMAFTIEAYLGMDKIQNQIKFKSPRDCFEFFNPPLEQISPQLRRWHGLWRELFYMKADDRETFRRILQRRS